MNTVPNKTCKKDENIKDERMKRNRKRKKKEKKNTCRVQKEMERRQFW